MQRTFVAVLLGLAIMAVPTMASALFVTFTEGVSAQSFSTTTTINGQLAVAISGLDPTIIPDYRVTTCAGCQQARVFLDTSTSVFKLILTDTQITLNGQTTANPLQIFVSTSTGDIPGGFPTDSTTYTALAVNGSFQRAPLVAPLGDTFGNMVGEVFYPGFEGFCAPPAPGGTLNQLTVTSLASASLNKSTPTTQIGSQSACPGGLDWSTSVTLADIRDKLVLPKSAGSFSGLDQALVQAAADAEAAAAVPAAPTAVLFVPGVAALLWQMWRRQRRLSA